MKKTPKVPRIPVLTKAHVTRIETIARSSRELVRRSFLTMEAYDQIVAQLLAEVEIPEVRDTSVVYDEVQVARGETNTREGMDRYYTLGKELDQCRVVNNFRFQLTQIRNET